MNLAIIINSFKEQEKQNPKSKRKFAKNKKIKLYVFDHDFMINKKYKKTHLGFFFKLKKKR
jgi:hypothetical protein